MEPAAFDTPYSDEWWFKQLFDQFFESKVRYDGVTRNRIDWYNLLWSWYEGNPPMAQFQEGWQAQVTKDVLRMGRANYAMLAVESKLDRLKLQSFRLVDDKSTGDPAKDDSEDGIESMTRRLMTKYGTVFQDALLYASTMEEGFIWVSGRKGRDGLPTVTAEDPRNCVAITDPVDDKEVVAAMKIYYDPLTKFEYAHVAMPAGPDGTTPVRIRTAKRKSTRPGVTQRFMTREWEWDDEGKSGPLPVQDRGVFVHRITGPSGFGDYETLLPLLERINNTIVDRLWVAKFQAFRQRALVDESTDEDDLDLDEDEEKDENGNPIDWNTLLSADPGALWRLPQGMKIWESTPVDLQNILLAARDDVKEYAATSRTPMYVFTPDAVAGSAEGASLARESQVFKVERWQERCQRPFLAACADMLVAAGHPSPGEIELQWVPADRVTMAQRGQAATAAKNSGVPEEGIWETFWQMDPKTIKRWKRMRRQQALFAQPLAPQFLAPQRPGDQQQPDDQQQQQEQPADGDASTS